MKKTPCANHYFNLIIIKWKKSLCNIYGAHRPIGFPTHFASNHVYFVYISSKACRSLRTLTVFDDIHIYVQTCLCANMHHTYMQEYIYIYMNPCSTISVLSAMMYECTVYLDAFHFICLVFDFAHAFCYFMFPCNRCNKEHLNLNLDYTCIYIYIYIYVRVCVFVCISYVYVSL